MKTNFRIGREKIMLIRSGKTFKQSLKERQLSEFMGISKLVPYIASA